MPDLPPAKKSLGQCFLVEARYAHEIASALNIGSDDVILEIGPGRGFLTHELLKSNASRVIAIEIDQRLLETLKDKFASESRFELHHADFVELNLASLLPTEKPVKVVGNLPYHLSASIIYKLLEHARVSRHDTSMPWIELAVLMIQKEVADRIVAAPGSRTYGKLSVFVQLEANAHTVFTVPAGAFRPQPKVDGGVVRFEFLKVPPTYPRDLQVMERMVRYCFHQRRKMLKGTLSSLSGIHPYWQSARLDFTRRPETLSLSEWVLLADTVAEARDHA
jgi:16S rRNA (adenine1518-N6/adenine1519-N6)-dimethyltransferase